MECCGKSVEKCRCFSSRSKHNKHTGSRCNLEEFVATKHAMHLVSSPNILSCFFIDILFENISVEFTSFMEWIGNYPEPGKSQLATLVLPVSVHLYKLMMQCEDIGVQGDFRDCPIEKNKGGELSGKRKKNEIDARRRKRLKHVDSNLDNIEISKIILRSKKPGLCFKFYDFDTEGVFGIDDISEYTDTKKKSKNIEANPANIRSTSICLRSNTRNASSRNNSVKPKKELKKNPSPKKELEVEKNFAFKSLHSVDFNSTMTEISYATGDTFIYSLEISTSKKEKKKIVKSFNNRTEVLRTLEHNDNHLKALRDPENQNVYVLKYLPTEPYKLLAAGCSKVKLFDTKIGSFLAEYDADESFIYDIDVDCTGQYFATATQNLISYVYTFCQNTTVSMLTGHEKPVTTVKFHPNGLYVATGSEDCTVRLFEVESGYCVRLFVGHHFGVWVMDISYDGHLIASADTSGVVNVWDIKDCTVVSKTGMHMKEGVYSVISSLCFHESSFVLAACNEKGEMKFWDARNPEKKHTLKCLMKPIKIKRHKGKGWNIAFTINAQKESTGHKRL